MFARTLVQAVRARTYLKFQQPLAAIRTFAPACQHENAAFDDERFDRRRNAFQGSRNRRYDGPANRFGGGFNNNRARFGQQNTLGESLRAPLWDQTQLAEVQKDFYQPHVDTENRSNDDVNAYRNENNIIVDASAPKPILSFSELQVPDEIAQQLAQKNFAKVTPIQAQGWPIALSGSNLVAIAQTG